MKFLKDNLGILILSVAGLVAFFGLRSCNNNVSEAWEVVAQKEEISNLKEENKTYSTVITDCESELKLSQVQNRNYLDQLSKISISPKPLFFTDTIYVPSIKIIDCPDDKNEFARVFDLKQNEIESLQAINKATAERVEDLKKIIADKDNVITELSKVEKIDFRKVFIEHNLILKGNAVLRGSFISEPLPTFELSYLIQPASDNDPNKKRLNYLGGGFQSVMNASSTMTSHLYKVSYGRQVGRFMFMVDGGANINDKMFSTEAKLFYNF